MGRAYTQVCLHTLVLEHDLIENEHVAHWEVFCDGFDLCVDFLAGERGAIFDLILQNLHGFEGVFEHHRHFVFVVIVTPFVKGCSQQVNLVFSQPEVEVDVDCRV